MAIFGVMVDRQHDIVQMFMDKINKNLQGTNYLTNPFSGSVTSRAINGRVVHIHYIVPMYPNYTWIGWITAIGSFLLHGPWWVTGSGIVFAMLGFFWSREFFIFMAKRGLKKVGYVGDVHILNAEDILEMELSKKEVLHGTD